MSLKYLVLVAGRGFRSGLLLRPASLAISKYCNNCRFYSPKLSRTLIEEDDKIHLSALLDVSFEEAQKILWKCPPLANVLRNNENRILEVLKILKKYGLTERTYSEQPSLLRTFPSTLENQILVFKETGIDYQNPTLLTRTQFRSLTNVWIGVLREHRCLADSTDIIGNYVQALSLDKSVIAKVTELLPTNIDQATILDVRKAVLIPFLASTFDCEYSVCEDLLHRTRKRFIIRNFNWIQECLKILQEDYKLPLVKILRHGYLLHAFPENLRSIRANVKTIAGIPLLQIAHERPKTLMQKPNALIHLDKLLETYGFEASALLKCPEILTLRPDTLEQRLIEIKNIPEFAPYLNHPRVLRLLFYKNKAKKRLDELQEANLGSTLSLNLLASSTKVFNRFSDREGKWKAKDAVFLLHQYIPEKTSVELRRKLQAHPNWLRCPLHKMKDVLDFLKLYPELNNNILFDALPIILYPIERVKESFQETIDSEEAALTDSYFLHMVLYMMEKSHNFSGEGIWLLHEHDEKALTAIDLEGGHDIEDFELLDEEFEAEDVSLLEENEHEHI